MSWIDTLAPRTRTDVQRMGRDLVGKVLLQLTTPERVEATVSSDRVERVVLERRPSRLGIDCSCRFHQELGDTCRHIWAVLLLADESWPPPSSRSSSVLPLRSELERRGERSWSRLEAVVRAARKADDGRDWPAGRRLRYRLEIDPDESVVLRLMTLRRRRDEGWSAVRLSRLPRGALARLPRSGDREILSLLLGAGDSETLPSRFPLDRELQRLLLPRLARSGRCSVELGVSRERDVSWGGDEPWQLRLCVREQETGYRLEGAFLRGESRLELTAPDSILRSGFLLQGQQLAEVELSGAFELLGSLRREGPLSITEHETDRLFESLCQLPSLPPVDLPEAIAWREISEPPQPGLLIRPGSGVAQLEGILVFDYLGTSLFAGAPGFAVYQRKGRRLLRRDPELETAALDRLLDLGVSNRSSDPRRPRLSLPAEGLLERVEPLLEEGWKVEHEGRRYRSSSRLELVLGQKAETVELRGRLLFGRRTAELGELIAAIEKGRRTVSLRDGSLGVVPAGWLRRFRPLMDLGRSTPQALQFSPSQIGLLDTLLEPERTTWDETTQKLRARLREFEGIRALDPPPSFQGRLRSYQREGLGWLGSLDELGFGGCLADDMGLGKTVQLLAHLATRHETDTTSCSLVVMPRSLVFNWRREAERFVPNLPVRVHSGADRPRDPALIEGPGLVLTTYGTLRRDFELLEQIDFDYLVLDEAQAIKNPGTATARAARRLKSRRRLALSGTPIENHLGELWSLLDFLNPGILGSAGAFQRLSHAEEDLEAVARAIRPFFLRRTKEEVAHDLPPRLEQILYCELDEEQRELYDRLQLHWRDKVIQDYEQGGGRATLLQALLRLRQMACHPALVEPDHSGGGGAKFEVLLPRLQELVEEGHKALVFSQFTSLLDLLEERLDELGLVRERLDGKTRDRDAPIRRFQEDPECPLLLVSLRAGGLGLNLTAADYVFLLDPWWNPAVEAQAIDRAHRIGRTRQVLAYRLVARDTLEERVLALQQQKRELAQAVIREGGGLGQLTREDLEALLG